MGYATVGTNDLDTSLPFFDTLLSSQGIEKLFDHPRGGRLYGKGGKPVLGVLKPADGKPATVGNGSMVALELDDRAAVDAMHAEALKLGGTDEGAPGERGPGFYFAYFRDLEGNKFAACKLG